jgi:biopolymer transport protein ExbD
MAMDTGGTKGEVMAAINVTPMADVMIVLLIIFMVMTPIIVTGHVEQLPAARNAAERQQDALVVWIAADTTTYLGDERLDTPGELLPRLQDKLGDRSATERIVVVNADARLSYATVGPILDLCREAGAEQIALATQRRVGI